MQACETDVYDDREPLCESPADDDRREPSWTSPTSSPTAGCRRRWLIPFCAEVSLVLFFFSELPVDIINQRYALDWFTERVVVAGSYNGSATSPGTSLAESSSPCSEKSTAESRRSVSMMQLAMLH